MQADARVVQKQLSDLLSLHSPASQLLLVIDQFEELFTQTQSNYRQDFIALLEKLVAQPQLRIIITLRADFYARAIEEPSLARLLRRDRSSFPLDPPGLSTILHMIIRPAEAAGVELEEGLPQRLLDDAGEGPGAMALIAFTLNQLYLSDKGSGYLSLKAYEAFGGVQGAVQKRAEAALRGLSSTNVAALHALFTHLVEVNEQEIATRRRTPRASLSGDQLTLTDALTEARLLVSGEGEDRQPTLEVAHETVLSGWDRLSQWISDHAETLRARRDLERVASEWKKSGRHGSALRTGRLLQRYLQAASPRSSTADAYLSACQRRQTGQRIGYVALGLLTVAGLAILLHVNESDYPPTLAAKALFVQLGLWPVTEPEMARIPAGEFQMGDLSPEAVGNADERPAHRVVFAKPFELGKYEVTFEEYDLFAAATGRDKPNDQGWERGDRPVINVSWKDAVAYAAWLSEVSGKPYRLPSEAEWEYAARAGTRTPRYWPDGKDGESDPACGYANVFDKGNEARIKASYSISWSPFECADDFPFTAPVGQFTANAWGLHDMLGNVWEWNQDCYQESYDGAPTDGSAWETDESTECPLRVLRGGSWDNVPENLRSADRGRLTPVYRLNNVGFRLARTL
jgi:formylglycine-generating enzyme required for sulfatase activity